MKDQNRKKKEKKNGQKAQHWQGGLTKQGNQGHKLLNCFISDDYGIDSSTLQAGKHIFICST